ncbi:hypothetical protein L345_16428, partial [Ophiophagus hannah]
MGSAPDTFKASYLEKKRRPCWCCASVCNAYLAEGVAAAASAPHRLENGERPAPLFCAGGIPARLLCGPHCPGSGVGDQGIPRLSSSLTLLVPISDINDNAPAFPQPSYTVFVKENNPPGAHIFTVSASDPDIAENALITYSIDEKLWPLSSYISVHSESGKLYALQSLDYEELKLLEFQVRAKDAGMPSLCGNVTVQVFVMDQNDNAPSVSRSSEENLILLMVPVMPEHIVGKIHALDADSGYNAWLSYELVEESHGPWTVGQYSGE